MKKPPLVKRLGLELSGVPHTHRVAAMIVLSLEFEHLRHSMHYAGLGSSQQFRDAAQSGKRVRWEVLTKREGGITETTTRNYLQCAQVVMERLRRSTQPGCAELLQLMQQAPSKLTAEQRQRMIAEMIRLAFAPDETFGSLRREARADAEAKTATPTAAPAPAAPAAAQAKVPLHLACAALDLLEAQKMERMALLAGVSPANAKRVAQIVLTDSFIKSTREARENGAEN
jgi:hypothetical protein